LHITVGAFAGRRSSGSGNFTEDARDGPRIEVSGDVAIALHLLTTGRYIAALPRFVMEHLCDERRFIRLAYHGEMPSRTLSIWYREDLGGHPLIKDFCRRLVAYVSTLRAEPSTKSGIADYRLSLKTNAESEGSKSASS